MSSSSTVDTEWTAMTLPPGSRRDAAHSNTLEADGVSSTPTTMR